MSMTIQLQTADGLPLEPSTAVQFIFARRTGMFGMDFGPDASATMLPNAQWRIDPAAPFDPYLPGWAPPMPFRIIAVGFDPWAQAYQEGTFVTIRLVRTRPAVVVVHRCSWSDLLSGQPLPSGDTIRLRLLPAALLVDGRRSPTGFGSDGFGIVRGPGVEWWKEVELWSGAARVWTLRSPPEPARAQESIQAVPLAGSPPVANTARPVGWRGPYGGMRLLFRKPAFLGSPTVVCELPGDFAPLVPFPDGTFFQFTWERD